MSRPFFTAVFLALVGPPLPGALVDPPSSLRPPKAPAKLRLVHEHRRVLSCSQRETSGQTTCAPRSEEARGGTVLVLIPVDAGGDLIEGDERTPVKVEFADERGPQVQTVELPPGAWTTRWPEREARFAVGPSEKLGFKLATTSGACLAVGNECVLKPGKRKRTLEIPPSNRLTD